MKSSEVLDALRAKYPLPEWAGFAELRDGTGFSAMRSVDFWAMNCYPSKGFLTVAIEVKVTRNDFFRELNNPKKRESAESIARETYFAVPAGLVKPEECPEGWGLIEVLSNGSARTKLRAKQRERPVFDEAFIASLMRRVAEDDQRVKRLQVQVDKANLAAQDIDAYLLRRETEHFEKKRGEWESKFRREATEAIMGEGYNKVLELVRKEFGYYPGKTPSECIVDLVQRAVEGKLEKVGTDDVRQGVINGIASLKKIAEGMGISL